MAAGEHQPQPVVRLGMDRPLKLREFAPIVAFATEHVQPAVPSNREQPRIGSAILTMPGLLGELAGRVGLHNAHLLVPTLVVATLAAFLVGRKLERRHPFAHSDQ
jgi:hypothetical protein